MTFVAKLNKDGIVCGTTSGACNDATCCDAAVTCVGWSCPAGFSDKPDNDMQVCGRAASDCSNTKCCESAATCSGYTCDTAKDLKDTAGKATVPCGALASNCTDDVCCDRLASCAAFGCPPTLRLQADTLCGTSVATCTEALCCIAAVTCRVHTCSPGFQLVADADTKACANSQSNCTDALCCVVQTQQPQPTVAATAPPPPPTLAKKNVERVEAAGQAAAVGAIAGAGAGAGPAMRLIITSRPCRLGSRGGGEELPRALHPTQWAPWGQPAAGMVLANYGFIIGFALVCFIVVQLAKIGGTQCFPRFFEGLDAQGFLRFPSMPLFIFQYFYQGTSLGGMMLVLRSPTLGCWGLGAATMLFCFVVPFMIFHRVRRDIPSQAVYVRDPKTSFCENIFIGPGEWASLHRKTHWVHRWASVVRTYRQDTAWFQFIEFSASFALAGVQAATTETREQCGHVKMASAVLFLILFLMEGYVWPHHRYRDSAADVTMLGGQMSGMLLMALGYYKTDDDDHWLFNASSTLMLMAVVVMLIKAAVDLLSELYIFFTKRRTRLQDLTFRSEAKVAEAARFELSRANGPTGLYETDESASPRIHRAESMAIYSPHDVRPNGDQPSGVPRSRSSLVVGASPSSGRGLPRGSLPYVDLNASAEPGETSPTAWRVPSSPVRSTLVSWRDGSLEGSQQSMMGRGAGTPDGELVSPKSPAVFERSSFGFAAANRSLSKPKGSSMHELANMPTMALPVSTRKSRSTTLI